MKISKTVEYAIQATIQLAESASIAPVPCSQLAARGEMPERFLLQILRNLVTHGILRSTRGVVGGYVLDRDPENISLLELIEAIEGPIVTTTPTIMGVSDMSAKSLQAALRRVSLDMRRQLEAIRLSHLMASSNGADSSVCSRGADEAASS